MIVSDLLKDKSFFEEIILLVRKNDKFKHWSSIWNNWNRLLHLGLTMPQTKEILLDEFQIVK